MDALDAMVQSTTLPKWTFFQKLFFKSSLQLNGCTVGPQTAATTFVFSSVCFFFYGVSAHDWGKG